MAITTRDNLVNAVSSGTLVPIYKSSLSTLAAGYIVSLWRATGNYLWSQGAIPSAAATCDDTLTGGILLPSFDSNYGYVVKFAPLGATANTFMLYDRLAHMGGLLGNATTSQTVGVSIATAAANGRCLSTGADVEWFYECYSAIGTTAVTMTVTYTDGTSTSQTTTISVGGASPLNQPNRCIQIIPVAGTSIVSIDSIILSATSGTAGSFGITARKKLASVGQIVANITGNGTDAISIGLPRIYESSCLEMLVQATATSTGIITGELKLAYA